MGAKMKGVSKPKMFTSKSFSSKALMGGKKEDPNVKPPKGKKPKMPFLKK